MVVMEYLQNWVNEVGKEAMINVDRIDKHITICTKYPGWFIGKQGCLFDKYTKNMRNQGYEIKFLEAHECLKPGDNWENICCERAEAFFETEKAGENWFPND